MDDTTKRWRRTEKAIKVTRTRVNIEKHVTTGPISMQSASGYRTYSHFVF